MAYKVYNNLNLPATLVHMVNGKKYTLNGKLLSINESTKLGTMQFGDKISNNIPLNEVYLNESALGDIIKKTGKKIKEKAVQLWETIKGVVKSIGGFLVPVDENGNELFQYLNNPLNLAVMPLPECIKFIPSEETIQICEDNDANVINDSTVDEAFERVLSNEREEITTYWSRVMKEYAKPENESLTLKDTVKMVNEKYYTSVDEKPLNETVASLHSTGSDRYGEEANTKELKGLIISNILGQINPSLRGKREGKPLLIWGAPGIGKTAVIKSAAAYMKEFFERNMDMVTVACSGLKFDDFELPGTAENLAGQTIAISVPKTWLPVYSTEGLTPEQIQKLDDLYNSGRFRIRKAMKDELKNRKTTDASGEESGNVIDFNDEIPAGETFDGGIIFFDEVGRVGAKKTLDTMMNIADREYMGMKLASGWCTLFAANRLLDDNMSEFDSEWRKMWGEASKNRWTHVTYVPTKEEWLEWAREVDKKSGYQNVDEIICRFIEKMNPGIWYDALDLGSRDIEGNSDAEIDKMNNILRKLSTGEELTTKETKEISNYVSLGKSKDYLSMLTWNGRTWDQKIAQPFLKKLRDIYFAGHPENFEACFSDTKRVRSVDGGYSSEEYSAKNLDLNKLRDQLNSIPNNLWYRWTDLEDKTIDPTGNLRQSDRLAFIMGVLGSIIKRETGTNNKPYAAWTKYNSIDAIIDQADVRSIYEKGRMKSKQTCREDNIIFDNMSEYAVMGNVKWKSSMNTVDDVISLVLDSFDKYITADQILQDQKRIEKNIGKYQVTPAEIQRFTEQYTLHLTDEEGNEIKTIPTLFNKDVQYDKSLEEDVIHVLKNSPTAEKMANLAMWIAKVSIQINQNTPIAAAVGIDEHDASENTIQGRYFNIIKNNKECQAFYQKDQAITKFEIVKPAITILNAMRQL